MHVCGRQTWEEHANSIQEGDKPRFQLMTLIMYKNFSMSILKSKIIINLVLEEDTNHPVLDKTVLVTCTSNQRQFMPMWCTNTCMHAYIHTCQEAMWRADLTDMFPMTATPHSASGRDVMTKSSDKMMNDITPKPRNDCSLKDLVNLMRVARWRWEHTLISMQQRTAGVDGFYVRGSWRWLQMSDLWLSLQAYCSHTSENRIFWHLMAQLSNAIYIDVNNVRHFCNEKYSISKPMWRKMSSRMW